MEGNKLIELKEVTKNYKQKDNYTTILENIKLNIFDGEIVGLIGKSGSGKSTLLRIISGLIKPTVGDVIYKGKPMEEADTKISMVFQNAGLVPWLNVFDNIALALENQNLSKDVVKSKVLNVINMVALNGYEEAYPKEISGGMRQRVGLARALAMDPEVLVMDEPFSALDYMTANTVKNDLLNLWFERSVLSIKSIIIVTHSIEEAVCLCDRVVVLSSNPGRVVADISIDVAHPRDTNSQKFHDMMDSLYLAMTDANIAKGQYYPQSVSVINLFHFLLAIRDRVVNNRTDTKMLADQLKLSNEQVFVFIEALSLLKFIEIDGNDILLSSSGRILLEAEEGSQKKIFKEHLVKYVPFISNIYRKLQDSHNTPISRSELLEMIGTKFSDKQASKILSSTISWARYADLFSYDSLKGELSLDNGTHEV